MSVSPASARPPLASGRMAEIYPWGDGRVIKVLRGNWPDAAQHEFRIARMAYAQGAVTPRVFAVVQEGDRPGIVYERVQGVSLLRLLGTRPWQIVSLARRFATLHHTIHRCRAPELHGARPALAQAIRERGDLPEAERTPVLKLLETLPDGEALLHGDFHPDNVMVAADKLLAIDWPNAMCGCPLADVARTSIMFRIGEPVNVSLFTRLMANLLRNVFYRTYLQAYFAQSPYHLSELARWEPVLAAHRLADNIPGEADRLIRFIRSRLAGNQ